ncbi:hypothetical protein Pcinc_019210 [Petrolisthes cinctipes]|uniref:Uncharacterized protein n=1 Tax=Petrolisthes cinctipes TaxID=88211 RepID=A0AAE1FKR7_PETCI|nr:hypothetical protein Pcinc_019210 [Petrolisthes cinctipes]
METDGSCNSQESCGYHEEKTSTENDEEDDRGTVIETSYDDMSLIQSSYTDKDNDSSSELSVNPVVWKKFKFLSSVLKETQHNLRAMDDLIFEHRRLQDLDNHSHTQHFSSASLNHPSHISHQGLGDGEPKTDEAKLEEILSLLHHLTHTLSSYEQHPLLASTLHPLRTGLGTPQQETPHWQDIRAKDEIIQHTNNFVPQFPTPSSSSLQHPQPSTLTHTLARNSDYHLRPDGSFEHPSSGVAEVRNINGDKTGTSHLYGISGDNTRQYTNIPSPDLKFQGSQQQETALYSFREPSPQQYLGGGDTERPLEMQNKTVDISTEYRKDRIIQTDSLLLWPKMREGHNYSDQTNILHDQNIPSTSRWDTEQKQSTTHHPLMKETRSLRKDIDDIVLRKQALDLRLQSLIALRQKEKEVSMSESIKKKPLGRSKSLEDVDHRKQKTGKKKYKTRSKSYEEKEQEEDMKRREAGGSIHGTYLRVLSEDQGSEFPSLSMESSDNGSRITDLRNDEADLPGLGDSGLSSEINSINATIQELVKENQQLHKFLQGMTCESIIKVDQEKLVLEAQIQSLSLENQSLKTNLQGENDMGGAFTGKKKATARGVIFSIKEGSLEHDLSIDENEDERRETAEKQKPESILKAVDIRPELAGSVEEQDLNKMLRQAVVDADSECLLNTDHLTKENNRLNNNSLQVIKNEKKEDINNGESKEKLNALKNTEETIISSKDSILSGNTEDTKEMTKLKEMIRKLSEENEILRCKWNEEACERDMESARLEARIHILSKQNKTLSERIDEEKTALKEGKSEMSCQTEHGTCVRGDIQHGILKDKAVRYNDEYPKAAKVEPNVFQTDESKLLTKSHTTEEGLSRNDDFPDECNGGTNNYTKNQQKGDITELEQRKISSGTCEVDSISHEKDTNVNGPEAGITYETSLINSQPSKLDSKVIQQLEDLMEQNRIICSKLSDLKSSSKSSEANLESAVMKVMERHVEVMENIDEKLTSAEQHQINEPKSDLGDLTRKNHELLMTLERQQQNMERLINQNDLLENKLQLAQRDNKQMSDIGVCELDSEITPHEAVSVSDETFVGQKPEVPKEEHVLVGKDSDHKTVCNNIERGIRKDCKTLKGNLSDMKNSLASTFHEKTEVHPINENHQNGSVCQSPELTIAEQKRLAYSGKVISGSEESIGNNSEEKEASRSEVYREERQIEENMCTEKSIVGKQREVERVELKEREEGLLKKTFRKEKENWMHLLEQTEKENVVLQDRISSLVEENNCLAGKLEEAVGVSQGTLQRVRQQLDKTEIERDQLQCKVRSLEEGKDESSLSLSESVSSSHLTHRLKDKIRALQGEAERGWQEAHQQRLEKDRATAQRESLECTSAIAITTARREIESLQTQLHTLEFERNKQAAEVKNLYRELERKETELDNERECRKNENQELERKWKEELMKEKEEKKKDREELDKEKEERKGDREELEKEREERRKERELLEQERNKDREEFERERAERRKDREELEKERKERQRDTEEFEKEKEEWKKDTENIQKELCEKNKFIELRKSEERTQIKGMNVSESKVDGERVVLESHWSETVARLKRELQQEQLKLKLLEAADHENSAHILLLQRSVRDLTAAQDGLQAKYDHLRSAYRARKMKQGHIRELSLQYTTQVHELGKASSALEENMKAMLSSLGENVDIAVDILASHVFLAPCLVHSGPDLNLSLNEWFSAQQARLRWLQTQLRKLCLHNWKTGNLPKTSHLGMMDSTPTKPNVTPMTKHTKTQIGEQISSARIRTTKLCDMTIVDEKSYTTNNKSEHSRGTVSSMDSSPSSSPTKIGKMIQNTSLGNSGNSQAKVTNLGNLKKNQVKEQNSESHKKIHQVNSGEKEQLQTSQYFVTYTGSSLNLSEAEQLLTSKQKELSEARYRQYKSLIHSLQRDLEVSLAPSPSVPSSILTTPEKNASIFSNNNTGGKTNEPSFESDVSISDPQVTLAPSPLDSPHISDISSASDNVSFINKTNVHSVTAAFEESQSSSPKHSSSSDTGKYPSEIQNLSQKHQSPPGNGAVEEKGKIFRESPQKFIKVEKVELEVKDLGYAVLPDREIKGNIKDKKLDIDKDVDSWKEESDDIIRVFVNSET